jgi:hypothetical protein
VLYGAVVVMARAAYVIKLPNGSGPRTSAASLWLYWTVPGQWVSVDTVAMPASSSRSYIVVESEPGQLCFAL